MTVSDDGFADLRALVLDDDRAFQRLLRTLLHQLGVRRVELIEGPLETAAAVGEPPFDLIFVEQTVAGVDGLAWVASARAVGALAGPDTAIVMVGSHPRRHQVEAAIDAGIDGFLAKPVSVEGLRRHLVAVFDRRRLLRLAGVDGLVGSRRRRRRPAVPPSVAEIVEARRREPVLSVPGLDVAIRRRTEPQVEALFLD